MASEIDSTVPADNVKVDKALVRANFAAAEDEITELQNLTSYPRLVARGIINFTSL